MKKENNSKIIKLENIDEYRNEKKFLLYNVNKKSLFIQYRLSNLILSQPYPDRWVNNIYFDNINFDLFNISVGGQSKRNKVRIRWYGNFSKIENPVLEFKIKNGHKNIKRAVPIKDTFVYDKNLSKFFNNLTNSPGMPKSYKYILKEFRPVLANRYFRSYHLSANKKYRVTTDTSLSFVNLVNSSLNSLYWKKEEDITIVELKFKKTDDYIINFMTEIRSRYRMTQISKYTHGLQL